MRETPGARRARERQGRLQAEIAERLLERLDGLRFEPARIVDLGCGTGVQARTLADRFGSAEVVATDRCVVGLRAAGAHRGWFRKRFRRVAADARALPLAEASIDLLYSNLMLPWIEDLPALLNTMRRVMRPGGLLLFSTFGPDTLAELRSRRDDAEPASLFGAFADVQAIGDAMLRAGFAEPVLDTDWITTAYRRPRDLAGDLESLGVAAERARAAVDGYTAPALESGLYPATWEVVYASAWAPEEGAPIRSYHGDEASVSVASIGRRER